MGTSAVIPTLHTLNTTALNMVAGRCAAFCSQVGMFPDVSEQLSLGHLGRGDTTSAMVASEWYMRNNHFPGWGRPYEFAAELFDKVGQRSAFDQIH